MEQYAFENVVVPAQVDAPHAARFVEMREGSFQPLASLPQQAFASRPPNAPTIAIHRVTGLGVLRPVASSAIGFRDIAAHADRFEIDERRSEERRVGKEGRARL